MRTPIPFRSAATRIAFVAFAFVLSGAALHVALRPELPAVVECEAIAEPGRSPDAPASFDITEVADPSRRALIDYLSRRYLIASEALEPVVSAADVAAEKSGLDPLLVLAVIGIESRFNPIAQSPMGAKGLMQIIPKYHQERLLARGGEALVLDPVTNVLVGTEILQEYVRMTGTLEAGLQFYNGASWDGTARYAQKVMEERARLEQAVRPAGGRGRAQSA